MQLIRAVEVQQPDFQWQYQLRHERDVTAQIEAARALEKTPSPQARKALSDIIENEQCFFKVRCVASTIKILIAIIFMVSIFLQVFSNSPTNESSKSNVV